MAKRDIVVIGASAGGFDALKQIVSGLPGDLPASLFIVWHIASEVRSIFPEVLHRAGPLTAAHAVNDERIEPGRIYVAPPDHHMLLVKGRVRLSKGPKENRFRPAIDPLFRSAAFAYGPRVIGVILSGALDDGTAGLWIVKEYGGLAVVQDPADAEVASMPENAVQAVRVDHVVTVSEIAALLTKLVSTPVNTGHAFSADALLAAITETLEGNPWSALRNIQESVMFLNHMGDHFSEVNQPKLAAMYFRKAKEAGERAALICKAISSHEQLNQEKLLLTNLRHHWLAGEWFKTVDRNG